MTGGAASSAFAVALLEFAGAPIPGSVLLLGIGGAVGLAGLPSAAAGAMVGALVADSFWFYVGRQRGAALMQAYCTVTLGSRDCTARTQRFFARLGPRALVVAKFVPGLSAFASPFAGLSGIALLRFWRWDALGALLWSSTFLLAGHLVGRAGLHRFSARIGPLGPRLLWGATAAVVGFLIMKIARRRRRGPAREADLAVATNQRPLSDQS